MQEADKEEVGVICVMTGLHTNLHITGSTPIFFKDTKHIFALRYIACKELYETILMSYFVYCLFCNTLMNKDTSI